MNIIEQIKAEIARRIEARRNPRSQEMPCKGLKEELDRWRHHHFAGERDGLYSGEYLTRESQLDIARHFAEWQKAKMMEDADVCQVYEVDVFGVPDKFPVITISCPEGFKKGDKVKVIIVKED